MPGHEDAAIDWVERRGDVAVSTKSNYAFDDAVWSWKEQTAQGLASSLPQQIG